MPAWGMSPERVNRRKKKKTRYATGSKIGDGLPKDSLFINVDLSPADQESDFQARKVRKESRRDEARRRRAVARLYEQCQWFNFVLH